MDRFQEIAQVVQDLRLRDIDLRVKDIDWLVSEVRRLRQGIEDHRKALAYHLPNQAVDEFDAKLHDLLPPNS